MSKISLTFAYVVPHTTISLFFNVPLFTSNVALRPNPRSKDDSTMVPSTGPAYRILIHVSHHSGTYVRSDEFSVKAKLMNTVYTFRVACKLQNFCLHQNSFNKFVNVCSLQCGNSYTRNIALMLFQLYTSLILKGFFGALNVCSRFIYFVDCLKLV